MAVQAGLSADRDRQVEREVRQAELAPRSLLVALVAPIRAQVVVVPAVLQGQGPLVAQALPPEARLAARAAVAQTVVQPAPHGVQAQQDWLVVLAQMVAARVAPAAHRAARHPPQARLVQSGMRRTVPVVEEVVEQAQAPTKPAPLAVSMVAAEGRRVARIALALAAPALKASSS